jgi:hypothetical protein
MNVTWNPDAVAPPLGDVYERERHTNWPKAILRTAFLAVLALFVAALLSVGSA